MKRSQAFISLFCTFLCGFIVAGWDLQTAIIRATACAGGLVLLVVFALGKLNSQD